MTHKISEQEKEELMEALEKINSVYKKMSFQDDEFFPLLTAIDSVKNALHCSEM